MIYHLILLFSVVTMGKSEFFPDTKTNLTKITWAHAVNNKSLLNEALESNVMMLEADISLGKLSTENSIVPIPIMAHPPANISDLSLQQFLNNVSAFNTNNTVNPKGVKLDFKSIEAFNASIDILKNVTKTAQYPIWLNADIIAGPVNATTTPVDAKQFLTNCKMFDKAVLSIGWTTNYNDKLENNSYTTDQIESMLKEISMNNVQQPITFPVRAGLAAESLAQMKMLVENASDSTLTIWSSAGDPVNVDHLRSLIFDIGLDKIYIDVPEELSSQLHLENSSNRVGSIGILSVLLSTIVMLLTGTI